LKAQLSDSEGFPITDLEIGSLPVVQVIYSPLGSSEVIDVSEQALPAGTGTEGNQFVFTDEGKWQFNLKTSNYTAAGTYTIQMIPGDQWEYVLETCTAQFVIEP
jgi:hypothetical protein